MSLLLLGSFVGVGTASAETNAERAESLNDQGKEMMYAEQFANASATFSQAITLSPDGKYYFNLCMSTYQEGKFRDSVAACEAVPNNTSDAALKDKAVLLLGAVRDEANKQGIDLTPTPDPVDPIDPNTGEPLDPTTNPNPNPNPGTGQPPQGKPPTSLFVGTTPQHEYTFAVGGQLVFGSFKPNAVRDPATAVGVRILLDYMALPKARIGVQGAFSYSDLSYDDLDSSEAIADFSGSVYKHFCVGRICATPLLGISIGLLGANVSDSTKAAPTYGLRLEGTVAYAFGPRMEHAVGVSLDGSFTRIDEYGGIDSHSASMISLGLGYTYRFNTPFGSSPFVTLE